MIKPLFTTFLVLLSLSVIAQDVLHKKDRTTIECKVVEIGLDEIKYKDHELEDSPIIVISIDLLHKVVLASGREIIFTDLLNDPGAYADDKKRAIKFHFLSPLFEHIGLSYEKSIVPGQSFETELGLIGLGFNTSEGVRGAGAYVSGGIKFLKTPDYYSKRFKYAHILKGAYVKPQLIFSMYTLERDTRNTKNLAAGAIMINIGNQQIYNNSFLIDYSVGFGYGISNQGSFDNADYDYRVNHYGFLLGDREVPWAISARLKIGLLVK
ncbi:hypothetical protein [Fulvivirga lutea]|uniref:DUF3575 domain-containing protein n=1 Tax=Fulvivirga lutea TaxID=2810512 RepID=A0A975A193_9BACT|nr:hypothetical protein [Fulvivirga lutea]QSE97616.1 hypothetical protein JR347_00575 [Fulvivirga lutea]